MILLRIDNMCTIIIYSVGSSWLRWFTQAFISILNSIKGLILHSLKLRWALGNISYFWMCLGANKNLLHWATTPGEDNWIVCLQVKQFLGSTPYENGNFWAQVYIVQIEGDHHHDWNHFAGQHPILVFFWQHNPLPHLKRQLKLQSHHYCHCCWLCQHQYY